MPLCRPTVGTRVVLRRASKSIRAPMRKGLPPTTVMGPPAALSAAAPAASDVSVLIRAECTDELFTAAARAPSGARPVAGVLHTSSAVPLDASKNLLNRLNSATWLSALPTLHRRGALTPSDEAGARRYLAGPTYQALLPWLWESTPASAEEEVEAATAEARRGDEWESDEGLSLHDGIHRRLASLSTSTPTPALDTATTAATTAAAPVHVDRLRTAAPEAWRAEVNALLPRIEPLRDLPALTRSLSSSPHSSTSPAITTQTTAAEEEAALLERLPKWHQVFFALSANPALNDTASALSGAHPHLLDVVALFYQDAIAIQQRVSPPLMDAMARHDAKQPHHQHQHQHHTDAALPTVVCSTRMPPILLRRWRRLYRAHGAYLLFSDVFRRCVDGEQEVLRVMNDKARTLGGAAAPLAPLYTTAVLQDAELFNFYLSLPGRRESSLPWEAQWQWTLSYAYVSFRWLFRMQSLALCQAAATAEGAAHRRARHKTGSEPTAVEATWRQLRTALSTLLNVTVWVRNNNEEGDRCQQALQTVLRAYWDSLDDHSAVAMSAATASPSGPGDEDAVAQAEWQRTERLLATFRKVSWECMQRKTETLHYAPSRGLMDVATLLAVLEAAQPCAADAETVTPTSESLAAWRQALTTLLVRPDAGVGAAWERLCTASSSSSSSSLAVRQASRYALVTLGCRLLQMVLTAARVEPSLGTAQRLLRELRPWLALVGRPLRLCGGAVASLWLYQLQRREVKSAPAPDQPRWSQTWDTLRSSIRGADAARAAHTWSCGCGYANGELPTEAAAAGDSAWLRLACASCVNRDLRPFTWECAGCHWVNTTGEALTSCLQCRAAHPALTGTATVLITDTTALGGQGAHRGTSHDAHDVEDAVKRTGHACAHPHRLRLVPGAAAASRTGARDASLSCCTDCGAVQTTDAVLAHVSPSLWPLTPLLHCCPDCGHTSMAAMPPAQTGMQPTTTTTATTTCSQCHSARAYWRGVYTWRCGCGADNHPSHHHCWTCTQERGDGLARYCCPHCQAHVAVQAEKGPCPHCHRPHPQRLDATATARLVACPSCHHRMPANADACPRCRSTLVRLVRPLLTTEADQPWTCHGCGHEQAVRDPLTGALRAASSSSTTMTMAATAASTGTAEACVACHTPRIPPAVWEAGRPWSCDHCSEDEGSTHVGLHCPRCLQLAPGVPPEEVSCWSCAACDGWNMSWASRCGHFGCGARQAQSVRERCTDTRWSCPACHQWSHRLPGVQACTHCGTAAPAPAAVASTRTTPTKTVAMSTTTPAATAAAPTQPVPPALAMAEQRLDDVEALLMQAARRAAPASRRRPRHVESTATSGATIVPAEAASACTASYSAASATTETHEETPEAACVNAAHP